ncbi:MAG: molybdopterin-dependent oxidoreductase [Acidimicrobiales bacterium]
MATGAHAEIRTTCPRDCYDACGVVVLPRPGRRAIVRGDKADPVSRGKLCRKCSAAYNGVLLDPDARLARPLRRRGAKGQGRFEAISWEAAIGEITERLQAIVAESGGAAVLNTHYTGTFAMIGYHFPMRFFNRLGATEVDPDTVCNKAGHVALEYVYGTSLDGFDPRTAADSACILVWGANPSASAPHQHEYWLAEAACPVVVVDPLRTATAKQADLHLQLRPGTDAVLAFALLHVLCRDGLIDREFLAAHSVGFDELESEIARCEPDRATAVTGVPAGLVEQAAHLYGAGPSLLWIGQGLQRQPTGGNVVRSVAMLPAVTGSLGRPGGGFLYLNGIETRSLDSDYLLGSTLAAAPPAPISQMDLASALEEADRFRALFCWNINIAASNPEQRRLKAAMQRESLFTVVVDLFQTDTADLADIVLPASSFLEHDDLVVSYFHHSLGAQVKALEPPGEALPNSEIFRRLARAMGYEEPELFESDEDVLARLLSDAGIGITFEELARGGTLWPEPQPRLQFADGRYPTPSGRIEIASERAEADGFSRTPLAQADAPPSAGRLRLLSPASSWTLNDSYGNDPVARSHAGAQAVMLNPSDAAARGLRDGDVALLRSETGELLAPVSTNADVPISVALVYKGHWPKLEQSGSNVNVLNPGHKSDMAESSAVHGIEVTVEPADALPTAPAPAAGS